ncbi:MAG: ABC transporter transmembrane domain-containing protein [Pseudomonadota bacterium]
MSSIATAPTKRLVVPPIGLSVLAATFALNVLALALPLVVLQIFDRVIPFNATETLTFLFLGLCLVALLEFTLRSARTVLLGNSGKMLESRLCNRFIEATLSARPEAFSKTTPAAHLEKFGAIAQLRGYYAGQGRILAIDLPFTGIFIAMIWLVGGWLVLVPLGCACLLLLFKASLQAAQAKIFDKRRVLDGRRYSFLAEALSQIRTLKANTMEAQILRRYELLQAQTTDISHSIIRFSGLAQSFGALFSQFAVAAMGLFGSYLVITKQIGIAELAACMLLNGRTVQPMLKALSLWVQSENISAARHKYEDVAALEPQPQTLNHAEALVGRVRAEKLAVKKEDAECFVFHSVDATLPEGKCMLLSGDAGSGKSEFMKLILGELTPAEGKMLIDDRPAADFLATRGLGGIGYVDHHPLLFAGTVLENMSAFGDGDAIEHALELSVELGVEKYIHRLPLGYNTQVLTSHALQHNAAALQGISLVRALALRPKLLMVNGIGAALDPKTRAGFAKLIEAEKGRMTTIIAEDSSCFDSLADIRLQLSRNTDASVEAWQLDAEADRQAKRGDGPSPRTEAA